MKIGKIMSVKNRKEEELSKLKLKRRKKEKRKKIIGWDRKGKSRKR